MSWRTCNALSEFGYGLGELVELRDVPGYYLIRWRGRLLLGRQ
jgi:hypothetical protein